MNILTEKEYVSGIQNLDLSIVIPLFNEEESLVELYDRIIASIEKTDLSREIVFVDDGSTDRSWEIICSLSQKDSSVHAVRFFRNYGKSSALDYAFKKVRGEVVITMDADLQDSPEEIPSLYRMIKEEKYDLVSGWKKKRYDPKLTKNLPSKIFNATARKVSGIKNLHDFNCGLKAYRLDLVKRIDLYNDMHRYIPILAKNLGYSRIAEKEVKHAPRKYGKSKYGISRFFNGFLDLITIYFMSRFFRKPMHFFGLLGTFMFLLGVIFLLIVLCTKLYFIIKGAFAPLVTDRIYFYLSLAMMILGVQLFSVGFLGEMIARQQKDSAAYIIREEF